jgi:hypothetical protein
MQLNPFKRKTDLEIKKDLTIKHEENLKVAARLKKLTIDQESGWLDFTLLLSEYIDACNKKKIAKRLDFLKPDQLSEAVEEIKRLDHEIFTVRWILQIPQQFISNIEEAQKRRMKQDVEI